MALSGYMQGKIAGWLTGTAIGAPPASLTFHLATQDPTDAGLGIITNAGGPHNNTITLSAPVTNEAEGAKASNTNPLSFTGLVAATVTHGAIYDDLGNIIMYGPLDVPITINNGGGASFSPSDVNCVAGGFLSQYVGEAVLNWLAGAAMPAPPANLYCALSTTAPKRDASTITEPQATDNYARKLFSFNAPAPTPGVGTVLKSAADVVFNVCNTNAWGVISHIAVFDAVSAGNMLFSGPVAVPSQVAISESFGIAADGLTLVVK